MGFYLEYILLGLSLAAPIGPVNAAQMERGIRSGFWSSWLLGLGSMTGDIIYLLVVYLGTVHFIDNPFMKTLLWFIGSFVLIYIGIESLLGARKINNLQRSAKREALLKSFGTGFFLSLLNPITIMFWIGIYGSVLAEASKKFETNSLLLYTCCILFGVFLWDIGMATISSHSHRFLNVRALTYISVLSGLSLIGFGVYLVLKL